MYYSNDPYYFLVIIAIFFSMFAQFKISSTYAKFSKVIAKNGYTGRDTARQILDRNGLSDIPIEMVQGQLSDHYDPQRRVIRLSQAVYQSNSIASISVAAHEVGHALQHQQGYAFLAIRSMIAPIVSVTSRFVWIMILAGFILNMMGLVQIGIVLFLGILVFQLVTLPVEFNASKRAIAELQEGFVQQDEVAMSKKVLGAAALTYVAATLVSAMQILRLFALSNRRRQ